MPFSLKFLFAVSLLLVHSAFAAVSSHQIPPHRKITQDDAPSMVPIPQNASHQGGHHIGAPFGQSHSKPASSASFTSHSGGGPYGSQSGGTRKKPRLQ